MLCAHIKLPQDVPSTGETNFFPLVTRQFVQKTRRTV